MPQPPPLPIILAENPDPFAPFTSPELATNRAPFEVGSLTLRPRASFEYQHDTGIPVRPGVVTSTSIESYQAGLALTLGSQWAADYSGVRSIYSNPALRDAYDQALSVAGGAVVGNWKPRWGYSYQSTAQPQIDTAQQTAVRSHQGLLGLSIEPGADFRLDGTFQPAARFADGTPTTRDWPVAVWIYHPLFRGAEIGAGLTAGYTEISPGTDLSYRRPQLQFNWRPDDRFLLRLVGGDDERTFYSRVHDHTSNWVYDGRLEYRPFPPTTLSVYRGRDLALSLFSGQISENTTEGVSLEQRLLGHLELTAGLERQSVHYLSTDSTPTIVGGARDDVRHSGSIRLAVPFRQRMRLSLSYQRTRNASTLEGYGFSSDQSAVQFEYRY